MRSKRLRAIFWPNIAPKHALLVMVLASAFVWWNAILQSRLDGDHRSKLGEFLRWRLDSPWKDDLIPVVADIDPALRWPLSVKWHDVDIVTDWGAQHFPNSFVAIDGVWHSLLDPSIRSILDEKIRGFDEVLFATVYHTPTRRTIGVWSPLVRISNENFRCYRVPNYSRMFPAEPSIALLIDSYTRHWSFPGARERASRLRLGNNPQIKIVWWGVASDLAICFALVTICRCALMIVRCLWRARSAGRCPSCSYPTAGLPAARCPECGRSLDANAMAI